MSTKFIDCISKKCQIMRFLSYFTSRIQGNNNIAGSFGSYAASFGAVYNGSASRTSAASPAGHLTLLSVVRCMIQPANSRIKPGEGKQAALEKKKKTYSV